MKKKITVFFLLFSLLFPSISYAETNANSCPSFFIEDEIERIEEYRDKASILESMLAGLIVSIMEIGDLNRVSEIIFGNPYCSWQNYEGELVFGVFTSHEYDNIIEPTIDFIKELFKVLLVIAVMTTVIISIFSIFQKRTFSIIINACVRWIVISFVLIYFKDIFEFLFSLDRTLVGMFENMIDTNGYSSNSGVVLSTEEEWTLVELFVLLIEWIISLALNFFYIFRKIMILLLMVFFVVACLMFIFEKGQAFLLALIKQLIGLVFIPTIHALLLMVFIFTSDLSGVIMKLILLALFIPMGSLILSLSGGSDAISEANKGSKGVLMGAKQAGAAALNKMRKN